MVRISRQFPTRIFLYLYILYSLEEAEAEAIGYQQSLGQIRNDFASMQKELSDSSPNDSRTDRGNSLFSEVDDRRQIVEGKLKRFKDQFESMKIQYDKKVQQLMKVKTQNVALLNRASANDMNPDHGQLYHLQDLLDRERNKNKFLNDLVENLKNEGCSPSNTKPTKEGNSTQDLLQVQIRQNLETDEKLRELTRKLSVMERNESKMKAENYQLRTEVSELKHRMNDNANSETCNDITNKPKKVAVREFIKFEKNEVKENLVEESTIDDESTYKVLSAISSNNPVDNCLKNSNLNKNQLKENNSASKTRRAQFSDADPIVYGNADQNTQPKHPDEVAKQSFCHKKKTKNGKRTTNTLINAKEESDKLKEQCAQQ